MTILHHSFQNFSIPQALNDSNIAGKFIPKGYVNATAMCKANNKTWSSYFRSNKAQSFASKVSATYNLDNAVISIVGGNDKDLQGTWVHIEVANHLLAWLQENNKQCNHNKSEAKVRDKLASSINGKTEVVTPSGNIDFLTSRELIEVKEAPNWKAAVGQVIVYGHYYPSHSKRIHLFGTVHSRVKAEIETVCKSQNIKVTWEQ